MPVYTITTTTETVSDDTKAAMAAEITEVHASITRAPTRFVHVLFHELPATGVFTDATPSSPVLIDGLIRAGRSDADKTRLATDISSSISRVTGIPEARILVSIGDRPARFGVEDGRVLPEPGAEAEWLEQAMS
jgi:phenylpyruvate tautomerase PptA (4-oxalocrotonate tautomerase family)